MTISLTGIGLSRGFAVGEAHIVYRDQPEVQELTLDAGEIDDEVARYKAALRGAQEQLHAVLEQIPAGTPPEIREFIDTHLLMLNDAPIAEAPVRLIREEHCNAEWALRRQRDALVQIFEEMEDPYLRTRRDDVDHVVKRVLRALATRSRDEEVSEMPSLAGRVIVADDLAAADVAQYYRLEVGALITEFGGPMSHTAILARSLKIPAVAGLHHARQLLREHDSLIVDGERGIVLADPDPRIREHYEQRRKSQERYFADLSKLKGRRSVTKDGTKVQLQANIERPEDVELVKDAGAAGIGLFRTEFLFMNRGEPPDEEEQFEAYLQVVEPMKRKPVTIRTLDLGADKQVDGGRDTEGPVATNPALGLRAIRLCLKDRPMFRSQLRALLRASAYGRVRIMVPMLTIAREVFQVKNMLEATRRELEREGHKVADDIPVGGMIEVPAAAISAALFAKYLDFLSIGTNDLIQYTLAIDRIDDSVGYLYDPLHPSVLKLLQTIIEGGRRHDTPVAMCGEMAGDVQYTRLLLGLGLRELSMHPGTLLEVKRVVTGTAVDELKPLIRRFQRTTNPGRLASLLREMNQ